MGNVAMKYKAIFHFTKEHWLLPDFLKQVFIDEYWKMRNIAVERINPLIDGWNKEFEEKYPNLDGWSREYAEFMAKKNKVILDTINDEHPDAFVKLCNGEGDDELGIWCRLNLDVLNDIKLYVTLEPIE